MSQIEKKVNPITIRSKNLIVNSLLELMDEKPYSEITLKEIAENAQLTRQTVYRNFAKKESILEYYVDGLYNDFINTISTKNDVTLYDLIITYFEYCYKNREFFKKLIDNNVYQLILDLHLKYLNSMATDENLKGLLYVSHNNYFNHFSAGGLWFALKKWIEDGSVKSPREMTKIILKFYHVRGQNLKDIKRV